MSAKEINKHYDLPNYEFHTCLWQKRDICLYMLTIDFFSKSSVSVNKTLFYNKQLENGYFSLTFKVLYQEIPRRYRSSLLASEFCFLRFREAADLSACFRVLFPQVQGRCRFDLRGIEFCFSKSREDADFICWLLSFLWECL